MERNTPREWIGQSNSHRFAKSDDDTSFPGRRASRETRACRFDSRSRLQG